MNPQNEQHDLDSRGEPISQREEQEENLINLRLDAGRGEVSKLSREATTGKRIGDLPRAGRRGYEFVGWFTDPKAGEEVTGETIALWEHDVTLYARYARSEVKKRSMFRRQRTAAILVVMALILLTVVTALIYHFVVDVYTYTDPVDGTNYYIRRIYDDYQGQRVYKLTDSKGELVPTVDYSTSSMKYVFYETASGSWVQLNDETGEAVTYAVVDTDGEEQVGFNDRVLMYPAIDEDDIFSIEVTNAYGTFRIERDEEGNPRFEGAGDAIVVPNSELFAALCSHCGYTLSARRVSDPIRDADGSFASEYGLDGSNRFTVTRAAYDASGKCYSTGQSYTVYVGNAFPSDGGYYFQLEGRDKVYMFSTAGGDSAFYHTLDEVLLVPVENLIAPMITYPMDSSTYYEVEQFLIGRFGDRYHSEGDLTDSQVRIEFSFVPLWKRTGTFSTTNQYQSDLSIFTGFELNCDNAAEVVGTLYSVSPLRCVKLLPTEQDLKDYGITEYRDMLRFGMWLDLSSSFVNSDGSVQQGLIPKGESPVYSTTFTDTQQMTDSYGETATLDVLAYSRLYRFFVDLEPETEEEDPEKLEYRVTRTEYAYFYGGAWLTDKDRLAAELARNDYTVVSDGNYEMRYDAAERSYYFRDNGNVYYGVAARRMNAYDRSSAKVERLLDNYLQISKLSENGTYYIYNALCDQIVEVSGESFAFLEWEPTMWVNSQFITVPLAYVTDIDLTYREYQAHFAFDNSESDQSEGFSSTDVRITASDSEGHLLDSKGRFIFHCTQTVDGKTYNTIWTVTATDYTIKDADTGKTLLYTGDAAYTATNAYGVSCKIINGTLVCTDGSRVRVGADTITVTKDGETVDYPRYFVNNFREFYTALMYASLEGIADLEEAEPAVKENILRAIREGDESACQLVLRMSGEDTAAQTNPDYYQENNRFSYVFRFYQYTKGKSYVTLEMLDEEGNPIKFGSDGEGQEPYRFYVKASFVEKLANDMKRVMTEKRVYKESKQ